MEIRMEDILDSGGAIEVVEHSGASLEGIQWTYIKADEYLGADSERGRLLRFMSTIIMEAIKKRHGHFLWELFQSEGARGISEWASESTAPNVSVHLVQRIRGSSEPLKLLVMPLWPNPTAKQESDPYRHLWVFVTDRIVGPQIQMNGLAVAHAQNLDLIVVRSQATV